MQDKERLGREKKDEDKEMTDNGRDNTEKIENKFNGIEVILVNYLRNCQ